MIVDTHCHLQFAAYNKDKEDVVRSNLNANMILNLVGTQKDTSRWAVELAEQFDNTYASIGTHPIHLFPTHVDEEESHFMSREENFDHEFYSQLVTSKKVVGIGECGLDTFHLPPDRTKKEVLEKQTMVFIDHINFAVNHDLPLVVHCRDAHDEMIDILKTQYKKHGNMLRGTIHCFTSNWTHAKEYLDMGFYLGFTGVITFPPKKTNPKPQEELLEVVDNIPLERMLVETDAPYLAPQKYRGQRSEPYMCREQIAFIADRRGLSVEEIETITTDNAFHLFSNMKR